VNLFSDLGQLVEPTLEQLDGGIDKRLGLHDIEKGIAGCDVFVFPYVFLWIQLRHLVAVVVIGEGNGLIKIAL